MADGRDNSSNQGEREVGTTLSDGWRFSLLAFPEGFDFIGWAFKLRRPPNGNLEDKKQATSILKEEVGRRLLAIGFRPDQLDSIEPHIEELIVGISGVIDEEATTISGNRNPIFGLIEPFLAKAPTMYTKWLEDEKGKRQEIVDLVEPLFYEILDKNVKKDVKSSTLPETLKDVLAAHLRKNGESEAEAARIARATVRAFEASVGKSVFLRPESKALAVKFAVAFGNVMKERPTDSFRAKAKIDLPPAAPALWDRKEDRRPNETPIAFLKRVWGPWLEADVLYQDDIKNLGDSKIVMAVRNYCRRNDLDVALHLPPPKHVRTERALAAAPAGSMEAEVLKARMRSRRSAARRREVAP